MYDDGMYLDSRRSPMTALSLDTSIHRGTLTLLPRPLMVDQYSLAVEAPPIAAQGTVPAKHSMAGH
jgi:hypothetical protein